MLLWVLFINVTAYFLFLLDVLFRGYMPNWYLAHAIFSNSLHAEQAFSFDSHLDGAASYFGALFADQ